MHGTHRTRPFADRGGDPLHRTAADITDCEHARHRRLERQRDACRERGPLVIASGNERSVRMNPFASSSNAPPSHAVAGSAPMKQKRPEQPTVRRSPVGVCSRMTWSRWPSPASARTCVSVKSFDSWVGVDPLDEIVRHAVRRGRCCGSRSTPDCPAARGRSRPGRRSCRHRPR